MDIQKEREAFESWAYSKKWNISRVRDHYVDDFVNGAWHGWQAKAQAVEDQLDVNLILHDIDCYFDNGLSNTERTANNLLQSIYEKLSGEVKTQEPAK